MAVVAFIKRGEHMVPTHPCSINAGEKFYLVVDGVRGRTHIAQSDAQPILDEITREAVDWHIEVIEEPTGDAS